MNAYQFVFQLHDLFSSPLTRIASAYNRVTGEMQRRAQAVSRVFAPVGNAMRRSFMTPQGTVAELTKKLETLKEKAKNIDIGVNRKGFLEANRQIDALERKLDHLNGLGKKGGGRGSGGGMGWLMAGGIAGMAYGAYNVAQGAVQRTVSPAMQMEATRFQLNEITNNPVFVKSLEKQFAAYAPEKMAEMISGSQKLLGAGVGQSEVFGAMKTLNNLSALSNTKVDELAFIQSKIKATGYVQGDEMDMFRERGISLNKQLAQVMGIDEDQVKKAQEKGLITYDKFTKALELYVGKGSRLEGVYERKRDGTTQGRYEFAMGKFNMQMRELGEKLLPSVNTALTWIASNAQKLAPLFEPLVQLNKALWGPIADGFVKLLKSLGVLTRDSQISEQFITKLTGAIQALSTVAGWVGDFFGTILHIASAIWGQLQKIPMFRFISGAFQAEGERVQQRELFKEQIALRRERRNGGMDIASRRALRRKGEESAEQRGESKSAATTGAELGKAAGLEASVSGAKSSVVNIHLKSMVERMDINVETLNEAVDNIEQKVLDVLTRLMGSASAVPN